MPRASVIQRAYQLAGIRISNGLSSHVTESPKGEGAMKWGMRTASVPIDYRLLADWQKERQACVLLEANSRSRSEHRLANSVP